MKARFLLFIVAIFAVQALQAQTSPAASKAKALVESGIAYFQKNGQAAAIAAFCDVNGKFRDGEYYLFMHDGSKAGTAICIARGDGNKALIGKDMWMTKDSDGKLYIQQLVLTGLKSGSGWVDYKRTNPETKKIEAKSSYVAHVPGTKFTLGCGFYKE
jgi:signal transduction histidine kinase